MKTAPTTPSAQTDVDTFLDFIGEVFGAKRTEGNIIFTTHDLDKVATRDMDWIEDNFSSISSVSYVTDAGEVVGLSYVASAPDPIMSHHASFQCGEEEFEYIVFLDDVTTRDKLPDNVECSSFVVHPDIYDVELVTSDAPQINVVMFEDARIVGAVPDELWTKDFTVLYSPKGAKTARDRWKSQTGPFAQLFKTYFSKHKVGRKDGPAVVLGDGSARSLKAMRTASLVGLDVDNGTDLAVVELRLRKLGILAVAYSTHSHMKTATNVPQHALIRFHELESGEVPTRVQIVDYLVTAKGIDPSIFVGRFGEPEFVHDEQPSFRIKHKPLPRFRLVFPLKEEYQFATAEEAHKDRIDRFKGRLRGLADMLDIRIDESCLDPSRLFYLPTHEEGHAFEITLIGGSLLDFEKVKEVESSRGAPTNVFEEAAQDILKKGPLNTKSGFSLKRWATIYADGFDILDLLTEHAPHKVREACSSHQGVHVECPFDEGHSNSGDPDDLGFFVVNGSEGDGYNAHCMHDSCQGRDRLDFLNKMIEDDWFEESLISDDRYVAIVADSDEEYAEKEKAADRIHGMDDINKVLDNNEALDAPMISAMLTTLASLGPSGVERGTVLGRIKKLSGLSLVDIREEYTERRSKIKEAEANKTNDEYERKAEKGIIYTDLTAFDTQVNQCWIRLCRRQKNNPTMFWSDQGRKVILTHKMGFPTIEAVGRETMLLLAAEACQWKTKTMEGDHSVAPPPAVIDAMRAADQHRSHLPLLKGIVHAPFFTETGDLVMEPGYNESGYYLHDEDARSYEPVPVKPTKREISEALDFVMNNILIDFPFDGEDDAGESSRCHALAMLLQPFIRPMIDGPTPVYFVDKPLPGTGATLLIDTVLRISTGRPGEANTLPGNEEEIRKTVMSALAENAPYFWLDNIDRTINSQCLASATTAPVFSGRRLGSSTTIRFPVRNQWIFCGNNVDARSEMIRRMVLIHLDPKMLDPTARTGFTHDHLSKWTVKNRCKLVHSCLVLCQAWIAEGEPLGNAQMASYEDWAGIMSGLMDVIGVKGFLGNADELKRQSDSESQPMNEFVNLWFDLYGCDIIGISSDANGGGEGLFGLLADQQIPFAIGPTEQSQKIALGKKLKMISARHFMVETPNGQLEVRVDVVLRGGKPNAYRLEKVLPDLVDE